MSLQMQFSDPEMTGFVKYKANILVVFPKIRYMKVFDITNPRHNEQISSVPWHFVKSRFHCK